MSLLRSLSVPKNEFDPRQSGSGWWTESVVRLDNGQTTADTPRHAEGQSVNFRHSPGTYSVGQCRIAISGQCCLLSTWVTKLTLSRQR